MAIMNEYLVKKNENLDFSDNEEKDFKTLFTEFTKPFMNKKNIYYDKSGILGKRENEKAIYIIRNKQNNLYNGKLWNDSDVEMIANMDYMYSYDSWDWWINPMYDSKIYKKEDIYHIHGKYGNTVLFVDNNIDREKEFRKILKDEHFEILDIKRQYEYNSIELFLFYDYYRIFMPTKLAREIKRIKKDIKKVKPEVIYVLLRGGYIIPEILNLNDKKFEFIFPSNFSGKINNKYFIDECIILTRNLKKMGLKKNSNCHISCLDCWIPKRIYEKEFTKVKFSLPDNLINFFSCRIFEKNPMLIGIDYNDENYEIIKYNNNVRTKFIKSIQVNMLKSNVEKLVLKMANDLFNYADNGYKNKHFEKIIFKKE